MPADGKMPHTKVLAFFTELPWLRKYIIPESVDRIYVKRIDIELLVQYPDRVTRCEEGRCWNDCGGLMGEGAYEKCTTNVEYSARVLILDIDGTELLHVGRGEAVTPEKIIPAVPAHPNTNRLTKWFWPMVGAKPAKVIPEYRREVYVGIESICESIKRLQTFEEKKDKGMFILSIFDFGGMTTVTIYKVPKGFNLVSWFQMEYDKARVAVQTELSLADNVS